MDRPAPAESGAHGHKILHATFVSIALLFLLTRVVMIESDPAHVTTSATFFTDEGFIVKNALLLSRYGEFSSLGDYDAHPGNMAITLYFGFFFTLFGAGLTVARCASLLIFFWALWEFHRTARIGLGTLGAAGVACICAVSINLFTFSMLALPDNLAASLGLISICLFLRDKSLTNCLLSLAVAYLAACVKASYVFTLGLLCLFWLLHLWKREMKDGRLAHLVVVLCAPAVFFAQSYLLYRSYSEKFDAGAKMIASRFANLSTLNLSGLCNSELKALSGLSANTNSLALILMAFLSVTLLARKPAGREREAGFHALAFCGWLFAGLLSYGVSDYQPARYYTFAIFPLAYLSLAWIGILADKRFKLTVTALVVAVFAITQIESYREWLSADRLDTYYETMGDACAKVNEMRETTASVVVVAGTEAATLALFCDNIRPLELHYTAECCDVCSTMNYWKPQFIFNDDFSRSGHDKLKECSNAPRSELLLASYRPMPGYAPHVGNINLFRIYW